MTLIVFLNGSGRVSVSSSCGQILRTAASCLVHVIHLLSPRQSACLRSSNWAAHLQTYLLRNNDFINTQSRYKSPVAIAKLLLLSHSNASIASLSLICVLTYSHSYALAFVIEKRTYETTIYRHNTVTGNPIVTLREAYCGKLRHSTVTTQLLGDARRRDVKWS